MTNEELLALEHRVNELKKLYDNYFAGIERREPLQKREQLMTELRRLTSAGAHANTQVQFRFNNLRARAATLEAHWTRVVKEIEEGRTRRPSGVIRAVTVEPPKAQPVVAAATVEAPMPAVPAAAAAPAAPPTARAPAAVSAPPRPPSSNDQSMRLLYDKYASSRAQAGEPPVSYESMVASLKKQVPAVIERYKCKSVDFRVAQKDGKTIIKAVPIT